MLMAIDCQSRNSIHWLNRALCWFSCTIDQFKRVKKKQHIIQTLISSLSQQQTVCIVYVSKVSNKWWGNEQTPHVQQSHTKSRKKIPNNYNCNVNFFYCSVSFFLCNGCCCFCDSDCGFSLFIWHRLRFNCIRIYLFFALSFSFSLFSRFLLLSHLLFGLLVLLLGFLRNSRHEALFRDIRALIIPPLNYCCCQNAVKTEIDSA